MVQRIFNQKEDWMLWNKFNTPIQQSRFLNRLFCELTTRKYTYRARKNFQYFVKYLPNDLIYILGNALCLEDNRRRMEGGTTIVLDKPFRCSTSKRWLAYQREVYCYDLQRYKLINWMYGNSALQNRILSYSKYHWKELKRLKKLGEDLFQRKLKLS